MSQQDVNRAVVEALERITRNCGCDLADVRKAVEAEGIEAGEEIEFALFKGVTKYVYNEDAQRFDDLRTALRQCVDELESEKRFFHQVCKGYRCCSLDPVIANAKKALGDEL